MYLIIKANHPVIHKSNLLTFKMNYLQFWLRRKYFWEI